MPFAVLVRAFINRSEGTDVKKNLSPFSPFSRPIFLEKKSPAPSPIQPLNGNGTLNACLHSSKRPE